MVIDQARGIQRGQKAEKHNISENHKQGKRSQRPISI